MYRLNRLLMTLIKLLLAMLLISACQPIVVSPPEAEPQEMVAEKAEEQETTAYTTEPEVSLDEATVTEIEALVEETMQKNQIPGVALGIVKDGQIVYAKGFGVAELGSDQSVTPQSLFHMASVAKTVTATGIMQLVAQGKIELDAPVTEYLPYFKMADERYKDITIRQLMTHTAGMPDIEDWVMEWRDKEPQYDDQALEQHVRSLSDQSLLTAPGEVWSYSNIGFEVLGDVIAKVSGQSFEEYAQENIFTPLGMEHTTLLVKEVDPSLLTSPHMEGETGLVVVSDFFPYSRTHGPSTTLYSHVEDMARYAMAHLNRGELDGVRILPTEVYDEMWSPYVASPWAEWFGPLLANYGLGWWVGEAAGGPAIGGYGADPGFQSHLVLLPEERVAIVAMVNLYDPEEGSFLAFDIGNAVMNSVLGLEEETEQAALEPAVVDEIETLVEDMMAETNVPGFSLGVVKDGNLAYAKGFGVTNLDEGEPVTSKTVFQLAEVTTTPTAMAILQLADQGKIDLDAPVTDYLSYFQMDDERFEEITVRHILLHRSGIPDSGDIAADWTEMTPEFDDGAAERFIRSLADQSLLFTPDEGFEISDMAYDVLGDIIAKVTGQSYEAYMQDHFLTPLGMTESTFLLDDVDPALLASPHIENDAGQSVVSEVMPYSRQFASANNLYSNVEDMARLVQANLNRGVLGDDRVLPEAAYDLMWSPHSETPYGDFVFGNVWPTVSFAGYGLGWFTTEIAGHPMVNMYGHERGYQAYVMLCPDEDLAVIIMSNAGFREAVLATANDVMGTLLAAPSEPPAVSEAEPAVLEEVDQTILDPAVVDEIESLVEDMMAENNVPGFSLGVVKDGNLAYAKGFGVTHLDEGEPVTTKTVFQLAEVTMTPTAMAILQLADQGKIDLDAPVTDYLPYFQMDDERFEEITVRHILLHRSGIPDSGDAAADWTEMTPELDDGAAERFIRSLADHSLLFAPDEGFEYSDMAYDVLGEIIAKVTGQSYEAYMQDHILTPLGMTQSTFLLDDVDPALLASPHIEDETGQSVVSEVIPYSRQFASANNLYSNVEDMARLAQANLNRGVLEDDRVLPEAAYELMWTSYSETPFGDYAFGSVWPTASFTEYGLGWFMVDMAGHPVYSTYGGERGYQSYVILCPDEDLAVITMGNALGGGAIYTADTANDVMGTLIDHWATHEQ